jgi:hypothetical protein
MADDKKKEGKFEDSVWKNLIEKVKKENRVASTKSIEEPLTKQEDTMPKSIESIEKPVKTELPIEKPVEEPVAEEKTTEPEKKATEPPKKEIKAPKSSNKFTTIMVTRELKERLDVKKGPKESYGDLLERLLKKEE